MKKYKGSDHDQQSLLSKIYCYLQQSQNIPMIPIHTMHEWSFCSTIIYNIYFWHTGNGRLWEPNQSLDGSDSLSSQKDEGTTRKILFPFWHTRMHQRLFLVMFCTLSQKWYFVSKIVLSYLTKNCARDRWKTF